MSCSQTDILFEDFFNVRKLFDGCAVLKRTIKKHREYTFFVPVCLSKLLSANCFHKSIGIACGFKYCCLTVKQRDDKCFIFLISETVPQHVFRFCVNIFILKGRALWSLHQLSDSATQLPDNCSKQDSRFQNGRWIFLKKGRTRRILLAP